MPLRRGWNMLTGVNADLIELTGRVADNYGK